MIRSVTSAYRILSFRDPCFSVIHLFRLSNRRGGEFVDVVRTHAVVVTFRRAFAGKPLGEPIKGGRVEPGHFLDDRAVDLTLFNALVAEKRARNLRLRERQVEKKAISKCRNQPWPGARRFGARPFLDEFLPSAARAARRDDRRS